MTIWIYGCKRFKNSSARQNVMVCFGCKSQCKAFFENCPALKWAMDFLKGKKFLSPEEKERRSEHMKKIRKEKSNGNING